MAIARGAGTEIIRSIHLEDVDSTTSELIFGVQHHIYTVLSIIIYGKVVQAAGNVVEVSLSGYDAKEGTTNEGIVIFQQPMNVNDTFVWNDKFSFNGHEPTDFAGPMDSIVKQDAIADQGSSVAQKLVIATANAADGFEVCCTFIDQNNS